MATANRREPTSLASMSGALAETLERHYGIDPTPLYVRAGLDPRMVGRAGARYPYSALRNLWEEAMRATDDPCLGLVVGQNLRPGSSQVLGFAWLASSTLEDALDRWVRYHRLASTAIVMARRDEGETAIFTLKPATGLASPSVFLGEAGLSALVSLCRRAATDDFSPVWVRLARPDPGQRDRYEHWFRSPIEFSAGVNEMALRHDDIRRRLPAGNKDLAEEADRWLARMLARLEQGETAARVGELLSQLMSSGRTTAEEVARRLNRSVSSLQRDLRAEGTSYRSVMEETRHTLARRLLREEGRSIGQVAFLLGYADQSTFTRAFRRWTGMSPGQFVREEAGGIAPPA